MTKTATQEDIGYMLTLAAKNGLENVREIFREVYFNHAIPHVALLSTLARIRYLEMSLMRGAVEPLGVSLEEVRDIGVDMTKAVLLLQVSSGSLTLDEVRALYPDLAILMITQLELAAAEAAQAKKEAATPRPEKYTTALDTLKTALDEIDVRKKESN